MCRKSPNNNITREKIKPMLKINAIGNVTSDPELRQNESTGKIYCVIRIACDRRYRDREGNKLTDFISVKIRDNLAELCADNVRKGDKIGVSGDFETITFQDDPARQPGFLIKATEVEFLSPRRYDEDNGDGEAA